MNYLKKELTNRKMLEIVGRKLDELERENANLKLDCKNCSILIEAKERRKEETELRNNIKKWERQVKVVDDWQHRESERLLERERKLNNPRRCEGKYRKKIQRIIYLWKNSGKPFSSIKRTFDLTQKEVRALYASAKREAEK